jgi:hypothetical protein
VHTVSKINPKQREAIMVKRSNGRLRAFSASVCAALIFSSMGSPTLLAAEGSIADVPSRGPTSKEHQPGSASRGNEWVPWAIIGGVIGAAAIAASAKDSNAHVTAEMLNTNGPRFPDSYSVGTFGVQGYVRTGWPVAIDFVSQPDTCTWLEISADQRSFSTVLDFEGRGGRRLVRIDLPDILAPSPRPAVFVVHSVRPTCPNHKAPSDKRTPSPVEVYGIGAGPHAVGSVAIDELQFGPPELRGPKDQATIAYRAESEFNHVSVEILRYDENPPGQFNVYRVTAKNADVAPGQNKGDPWDGKNDSGARSLGVHRLQVRAWYTENDQSWVGAISPSSVYVAK